MTLDEVLTIANRAYHDRRLTAIEPKYIPDLRDVAEYIWTNADQLRRAHKLKEVEARCATLLSENDALEAENTELYDELTETKRALSDLMNELRELKSR
jgi:chromosome segregation ATPase